MTLGLSTSGFTELMFMCACLQFDDLGWHGTKVIVFNLWLNDDGILELDFDSDEHVWLSNQCRNDMWQILREKLYVFCRNREPSTVEPSLTLFDVLQWWCILFMLQVQEHLGTINYFWWLQGFSSLLGGWWMLDWAKTELSDTFGGGISWPTGYPTESRIEGSTQATQSAITACKRTH